MTWKAWKEALEEAVRERNLAEQAFVHASIEYCDFHIYRLQAAEEKVRMILREARSAMGYETNRRLGPPKSPVRQLQSLISLSGQNHDQKAEDE
ncbi:MAG: hypothetical protein M1294_10000 [Firmicutes bacterium]|jgi:hypothetical protein|uniref:DUF2508 domain-containing protein n=1 Tax=Sulfobacillus benefaciens TaxID=453960 RepID=A0A2T2X7H0_9FIRM|nr:hypothetical protein [Bacillota bacterium]MCL5013664.1 hypothetical protein [Bacillota bacterium]PSR30454.1 MAG: hypothetical protein C7B43_06095 [Sulfobacillus benefaciens]HBQ94103.1 hypothetical protein [Sulfobacillus sp.]